MVVWELRVEGTVPREHRAGQAAVRVGIRPGAPQAEEVAGRVQDAINATVAGLLVLEGPLIDTSARADDGSAGQGPLDKLNASDRAPTRMRLRAQIASRLNQLRDKNLRPR